MSAALGLIASGKVRETTWTGTGWTTRCDERLSFAGERVITHADGCRGGSVFNNVCLFVGLFFRTISQKSMNR